MEAGEVNNYVSVAYRQDMKPLGLFCFMATNDDARQIAIDNLPPPPVLEDVGVTVVYLITRVCTHETWPNCHRPGCPNKASLSLHSPFCYPHHLEIANGSKEI